MKVGIIIPKKVLKHSQGSVKRQEQHKAYFGLKPQEWDREKDHQIKCKPSTARVGQSAGFKKTFYQLQGDEPPKKWILWKKDVNEKIITKSPDWELIFSSLIDLTNKAVSTVIYNAFFALNISEGYYVKRTWPEYAPFCNKKTQKKLLVSSTKADGSVMNAIKGKAV